jgi:Glycosyltransferase family 87
MSTVKTIPYWALALVMAVPAILVGLEIPTWYFFGSQPVMLQSDLRVLYTPAYMLRTGQRKNIYNFSAIRSNQEKTIADDGGALPFLHPAYEAGLVVPLSFLPYRAAYFVWAFVNFAVLALVFFLFRDCLPHLSSIGPKWTLPALLLGFMPIAFAILEGQDSIFLLLIVVVAYRRIASHQVQAGMLLGLGAFRFQIILPIIALFLVWRGLKIVAGWIVSSAAMWGASVAITGIRAQMQYIELLHQVGRVSSRLLLDRMPNIRALFTAYSLGIVPIVALTIFIFVVAAVVGNRENARQKLFLAVCVSSLVPWYLFIHDLSLLALPILVAIDEAIGRKDWLSAALPSAVLCGFGIFWFTRSTLYVGVLFTLFFFATQVVKLWSREHLRSTSLLQAF